MRLNTPMAFGKWNIFHGCLNQTSWQLRFPAAAIESEHDFVDVLLQLSAGHSFEGAQQKAFQTGYDEVRGWQPFVDFPRRCDLRLMAVALRQCLQGGESALRTSVSGAIRSANCCKPVAL